MLTLDWRMSRKHFALSIAGYLSFFLIVLYGFGYLSKEFGSDAMAWVFLFLMFVVLPFLLVKIIVHRLHDINYDGRWFLLGFVPLVGIVCFIMLFFIPGTIGENRFGSDPRDRPEII
jgi:uncharacterized membrane protein YhaH (DUF805 family)